MYCTVYSRILDTLVSHQHARNRVQRVVVGWMEERMYRLILLSGFLYIYLCGSYVRYNELKLKFREGQHKKR